MSVPDVFHFKGRAVVSPPTELDPLYSCHNGLSLGQHKALAMTGLVAGLFGLAWPNLFALLAGGLLWTVFCTLILWRLSLVIVGYGMRLFYRATYPVLPTEYPVYSVMIAAYKEVEVADQLARAMSQIIWPAGKLDIQILLEADDEATRKAMRAAPFPEGTRFTIVPPGGVRTKSNALNHGLTRTRGEFVCIYDAEDRPHPGQLLEAYRKFLAAPGDVVCAQAPLVGDNDDEAWIAAHWNLEYATQFGLLLPAQAALDLPIAIGGTSNHFRVEALRAAGGWDAWNVTEDADLGLRFSRFGQRVMMLNLPTYEDAPARFDIWAGQRSRWIKGFMQTWIVLMRRPGLLLEQLGLRRFLAVQLSLGGAVLAPLFHGPLLLLVLTAALSKSFSLGTLGLVLLGTGLMVGLLGDLLAPAPWTWGRFKAVLTRPFYWPLHSISAARALYELAVAPHFWAKTPHKPRQK